MDSLRMDHIHAIHYGLFTLFTKKILDSNLALHKLLILVLYLQLKTYRFTINVHLNILYIIIYVMKTITDTVQ